MTEKAKKEDRRVRRTKKILTQALTELMQVKSINEITVKELTDLADMNRGTFYLYYRDIFDMLEKIEDGLFRDLDALMVLHRQEMACDRAKPILLDLFRFIGENREMCRVLLSPHGDMNFLQRLYEVIREKSHVIMKDRFSGTDEEDFNYRYAFAVFGCAGLIRAWVNRDCAEPEMQMAELADALILRGILAE